MTSSGSRRDDICLVLASKSRFEILPRFNEMSLKNFKVTKSWLTTGSKALCMTRSSQSKNGRFGYSVSKTSRIFIISVGAWSIIWPVVRRPLFFVTTSSGMSVRVGIWPSATLTGRRFFNPTVVYSNGFAMIRFNALKRPIKVDIVLTLTAVEPLARIDSIDVKSGTTPMFSTLFPLQLSGPVKGCVWAYSLIGFRV